MMTLLAALCVASSQAGGLYVYEVDPASADRPKAAWLNPAGLSGIETMAVESTLAVISPKIEFESTTATAGGSDGGNAGSPVGIPDISFAMPINERVHFGVSVTGLFGGAVDFGKMFVGRYSMIEVELSGLAVAPAISYKVNDDFSFGVGAALVQSAFDETIAINNNNPILGNSPATPDGSARFDSLDDTGVQPFVGIAWRVNPKSRLGVVYRAEMELDLEGRVVFNGLTVGDAVAPEVSRPSKVEWTNPQAVEVGLSIGLNERTMLTFNADWEDWSEFSDNTLTLDLTVPANPVSATVDRNWKDTQHYAVNLTRVMGTNALTVGVAHDTSPVEDEDRTFDLAYDAKSVVQASYLWGGNPNRQFALSGGLMFLGDGKIDQVSQGEQTVGEFDKNSAVMIAGTMIWKRN